MSERTYKELILEGERLRETGNIPDACVILRQAIRKATRSSQLSNAKRHLGLCFEHQGHLAIAEDYYREALQVAQETNDLGGIARAKRHLLSVELKREHYPEALWLGIDARQYMLSMSKVPTDLIWVTHGIVKVLIDGKFSKSSVRRWALNEWSDLKYMWPLEKNLVRKRVWTTGWMMDAGYAWAPWLWPLLPLAFLIAFFSGLRLRTNQMLTGKR